MDDEIICGKFLIIIHYDKACQAFQPSGGILHVHGNVPKCDNRVEGKCPCLSMAVVLNLFWDATHFVLR
ncbi:hypothetical protein T05_1981 [Trichinella murrelli]|uniref:Uncharacterized protein n=1 Tax=Trichinella murrelli TaxID=144512 RepID=A0A0V0T7J5_9BILA|nr:hypothetical protein T05_1981 [Trichinella murrelli]